jgi:hypothetical protein
MREAGQRQHHNVGNVRVRKATALSLAQKSRIEGRIASRGN